MNPIILICGDTTVIGLSINAAGLEEFLIPNSVNISTSGHRLDQVKTDWENSAYYANQNIVAIIVCAVINDIAAHTPYGTINTRKQNLIASIRASNGKIPILFNAPNPCKQRWIDAGFTQEQIDLAEQTRQDYVDSLVNDPDLALYSVKQHAVIANDGLGNIQAKYNLDDDHINGNNAIRQIQAEFNRDVLRSLKISCVVARCRLSFATLEEANTRAAELDLAIGNPRNGTSTVGSLLSGSAGKILIDSRTRPFLTDNELRSLTIAP